MKIYEKEKNVLYLWRHVAPRKSAHNPPRCRYARTHARAPNGTGRACVPTGAADTSCTGKVTSLYSQKKSRSLWCSSVLPTSSIPLYHCSQKVEVFTAHFTNTPKEINLHRKFALPSNHSVQNGPQSIRKSWARQTWPTGVVRIRQKLSLLAPSTPGSRKEIGSKTAAACTKPQKNSFFNMDPGKQVSLISYSFF